MLNPKEPFSPRAERQVCPFDPHAERMLTPVPRGTEVAIKRPMLNVHNMQTEKEPRSTRSATSALLHEQLTRTCVTRSASPVFPPRPRDRSVVKHVKRVTSRHSVTSASRLEQSIGITIGFAAI